MKGPQCARLTTRTHYALRVYSHLSEKSRAVKSGGAYSRNGSDRLSEKIGKREFRYAARHALTTSFPAPKQTTRSIASVTAQGIGVFPQKNTEKSDIHEKQWTRP
jgi:hypothetical protein